MGETQLEKKAEAYTCANLKEGAAAWHKYLTKRAPSYKDNARDLWDAMGWKGTECQKKKCEKPGGSDDELVLNMVWCGLSHHEDGDGDECKKTKDVHRFPNPKWEELLAGLHKLAAACKESGFECGSGLHLARAMTRPDDEGNGNPLKEDFLAFMKMGE